MRELSIFVDESGDFGEYEKHSPYYIVSMVFHDQAGKILLNRYKEKDFEKQSSRQGYLHHYLKEFKT